MSSSVTKAVDAMRNLPKTSGEAPGFRTCRTVVFWARIPLNGTAILALERLQQESIGNLVFPNAESPRGWFLAAVERAGLKDYTWHCNRHTFASRLVMAGVDLHTVGELMGHRTAQMTKRYAHLTVNHKQASVERISVVQSAIRTATGSSKASRVSRKSL